MISWDMLATDMHIRLSLALVDVQNVQRPRQEALQVEIHGRGHVAEQLSNSIAE